MPAYLQQVKQEHQQHNQHQQRGGGGELRHLATVASLPGVPSHPSQLAQHTPLHQQQQHQHPTRHASSRSGGLTLNNHSNSNNGTTSVDSSNVVSSDDTAMAQVYVTTTAPASTAAAAYDESQIDVTSQKGIFGWAVIDRTSVPYIIREKKRFVSVRMVEMKLLSRYPSTYPAELKDRAPLMSQYVTPAECRLLNEINFEHCASEFGAHEFSPKDLIVALEDFEDFYNIVKKHFPEDALASMATAKKAAAIDGGWMQVNNTVVPYVVRATVKLVPLSVIRYAAGLLADVKVHGIEPHEEECVYLNKSCKSAGLEFNFAKSTKMIELKLIPNLSDSKVSLVELPKNDPFGHAEYQELPEEQSPLPQMGATLPVNMPLGPQPGGGVQFIPPGMAPSPGGIQQQQRGMLPPRMPGFEGIPGHGGPPPPPVGVGGPEGPGGVMWMNPHVGVFPGFQGAMPPHGHQMVPPGMVGPRPMGPRSFTATQSSPAGTLPPGYVSAEGPMQPPNHHALQNLQHMTQMAEMQAAARAGKQRPSSRGSSSRQQQQQSHAAESMAQARRASSSGGSAHVSPPQLQLPQSQLSPRLPGHAHHSPGAAMMEGLPAQMNGGLHRPPPGGMMMLPPGARPTHPAHMMRMHAAAAHAQQQHPGAVHPWQLMSKNPVELQEMMRQMPAEMLAGMQQAGALQAYRASLPRSQHPHAAFGLMEMERGSKASMGSQHAQMSPRERQHSPRSRSPATAPAPPKEASPPAYHPHNPHHQLLSKEHRERGRHKSTPTRISPTRQRPDSPSLAAPSPPKSSSASQVPSSIKPVEFHKKTISCLVKDGDCYALVEAISRVYFPYCTLEDFQHVVEKVLQIRICQLNRDEEAMFIKFYGLPTKSLRCNKCVHLRDFDEFMPQLRCMFRDKEPAAAAVSGDTVKNVKTDSPAASTGDSKPGGDSNNNAKASSDGGRISGSSGANSKTFQALKKFLGKRGSDGSGGPPSKAARGFASRLEDAVNRLKKQKQQKGDSPTPGASEDVHDDVTESTSCQTPPPASEPTSCSVPMETSDTEECNENAVAAEESKLVLPQSNKDNAGTQSKLDAAESAANGIPEVNSISTKSNNEEAEYNVPGSENTDNSNEAAHVLPANAQIHAGAVEINSKSSTEGDDTSIQATANGLCSMETDSNDVIEAPLINDGSKPDQERKEVVEENSPSESNVIHDVHQRFTEAADKEAQGTESKSVSNQVESVESRQGGGMLVAADVVNSGNDIDDLQVNTEISEENGFTELCVIKATVTKPKIAPTEPETVQSAIAAAAVVNQIKESNSEQTTPDLTIAADANPDAHSNGIYNTQTVESNTEAVVSDSPHTPVTCELNVVEESKLLAESHRTDEEQTRLPSPDVITSESDNLGCSVVPAAPVACSVTAKVPLPDEVSGDHQDQQMQKSENACSSEQTLVAPEQIDVTPAQAPVSLEQKVVAPAQTIAVPEQMDVVVSAQTIAVPEQMDVVVPAQTIAVPEQTFAAPEQMDVTPAQAPVAPEQTVVAPPLILVAPETTVVAPAQTIAVPEHTDVAPAQTFAASEQTAVAPAHTIIVPAQTIVVPEPTVVVPAQTIAVAPEQMDVVAPEQMIVAPAHSHVAVVKNVAAAEGTQNVTPNSKQLVPDEQNYSETHVPSEDDTPNPSVPVKTPDSDDVTEPSVPDANDDSSLAPVADVPVSEATESKDAVGEEREDLTASTEETIKKIDELISAFERPPSELVDDMQDHTIVKDLPQNDDTTFAEKHFPANESIKPACNGEQPDHVTNGELDIKEMKCEADDTTTIIVKDAPDGSMILSFD